MGISQSVEETQSMLQLSERENPNATLNGITRQGSTPAPEHPLQSTVIDLYESLQPEGVELFKRKLEDREDNGLLDQLTPENNTVLHIAARFGISELVQPILERRPRLLTKANSNDDLPLHLAAARNSTTLKVIQTVVNFAEERDMFKAKNTDGDTPLHVAMRNNRKDVARLLIMNFREASYILNKEDKSPLYMAAEAGDLELVQAMIHDYDTPTTLSTGKSVVHAAITGGNLGVLKEILRKDRSLIDSAALLMGTNDSVYPLSYAAYTGNTDMVKYMVKHFPHCISKEDGTGTFPIHLAAEAGHKKVIEVFLRLKPDSRELRTRDGENILHVAAKNGKDHVVKYLLKKSGFNDSININARDKDGNTPLHLATLKSYPKVVDTLTWNKRVRLDAVNHQGMTPMDVAMNKESRHTFKERLTWLALRYAGAPRRKYALPRSLTLSDSSNMESFKNQSSTLLVVATLVTTMSFTAGLQMPGGNGHGNSFLKWPIFQMFLITNSMAFYASILSMLIFFFALLDDVNLIQVSLRYGEPLLAVSLVMVSIALMSAAYLVGSTIRWLAFTVWLLGSVFLAAVIPLFFLLFPRVLPTNRHFKFILRIPFRAMVYVLDFKWE